MAQCERCREDTQNPQSIIKGAKRRFCSDCREAVEQHDEPLEIEPATSAEFDVDSIREQWTANSVRLPDSLQRRFNSEFKRIDYELTKNGVDQAFGKDRQFKPLVVALGLRELQNSDAEEVSTLLDALENGTITE